MARFCHDIVKRASVMVLPGDVFEYPGNHFRVGLGRSDLPRVLEMVDGYLLSPGAGRSLSRTRSGAGMTKKMRHLKDRKYARTG